jgi:hypothetical protein
MINYRGEKIKVEDVRQEDIQGMACDMSDLVESFLESEGILDPPIKGALHNGIYDKMVEHYEKMFNYPEYRSHN